MAKNPNLVLEPIPVHSQIFIKKFQQQDTSPSSHELCLLKKEFKKRLEFLQQTNASIQQNKDEVGLWIKGNDVKIKVKGNSINVQLSEQGTIKIQKQVDYSKVKVQPASQIPYSTFQSYCDQYFKPITEGDIKLLEKDCDPSAFIIPSTVDYYKDRFKQEDLKIHKLQLEGIHPSGKEYYEHDDIVYEGEAPTGQTSTRLLGCLVNEGIVPALEDEEVGTILDSKDTLKRNREDMGSFQDRLRDELYFLGMLEPGAEEPSEIRDELIQTINELKSVVDENRKKKDILIKHAEFHLGYQEYLALLTDVNKTIEQLYIKKFKRSKPSIIKKKPAERETTVQQALDSRRKLIEQVGNVYFKKDKLLTPKSSIYE